MESQPLSTQRWQLVKDIFQAALEQPVAARADYLQQACANDDALRAEVESLLAAHAEPGSFLDTPAVDLAGEQAGDSLIGRTLGRYRVLALLGRGGMGEVYQAKDTQLGRDVALKVLNSDFASDENRLRRFEQEARAASALNHPNIITIHEFGQAEGRPFIVSELIEGETLRRRLARAPLAAGTALDMALQIASALAAAHEAGIVHRDIKPENLMIRPDGLVKVLDFGLAKLVEPQAAEACTLTDIDNEATTAAWSGTQPGMLLGTVNYMSPEQARGQRLDARSDLFSLGVVLYEMLTGSAPFARATVADTLAAILEKEPVPLAEFSLELAAPFAQIIHQALHKERTSRYQSAAALLADLQNVKSGASVTAPPLNAGHGFWPQLKRRRRAALVAATICLAVIASALWYYESREPIEYIAVVPRGDGNAEADYLADGICDTLINDLSRLPNLAVRPRNSSLRDADVATIGSKLNVTHVLTVQVTQRHADLIVNLSLIDVQGPRQLWGARHQRPQADLLLIQADLAREVGENLRPRLPQASPQAHRSTANVEAYHAYLRGRHFWNQRNRASIAKAIEAFRQAIALDAQYALAYAGLADCYLFRATATMAPAHESFPPAKEAAQQALALDDALAEAHTSLAQIALYADWDWANAERGFKRALQLNPNYPTAHQWYAGWLSLRARHVESLAEIRRAQQLDPLSNSINADVARILYYARQYAASIQQSLKAAELDPAFHATNTWLNVAYEMNEQFDEAVATNLRILTARNAPAAEITSYRKAYASGGWRAYWEFQRHLMEADVKKQPVDPFFMAINYIRVGDLDQALTRLEQAYAEHHTRMLTLKVEPRFDVLRTDPRFIALLRRVHPVDGQ
jgi:serine/threonine-protein kinase